MTEGESLTARDGLLVLPKFLLLCALLFLSALIYMEIVVSPLFRWEATPEHPPLVCSPKEDTTKQTCPSDENYPKTSLLEDPEPPSTCPDYFRWIHQDLRPWKETGITREMVEAANKTANFRLVILNGRVHLERYKNSFQTRDLFTLWGILQLVRWYPGMLPDLELMFDCDDGPHIRAADFPQSPPPLFKYCSDEQNLDIVFPDWSFWGWAETNIKPWRILSRDIREGNTGTKWKDRVPYAYWRGNPTVCGNRMELMKCNVSKEVDWNARFYVQDWDQEAKEGYKHSNLEDQCTHRYKVYIEGWAWSVSQKYILACDSMTLRIMPVFHDFFTRGLVPLKHYWPIRNNDKCRSLKFAVEWGNNHTHEAEAIGKAGSSFILEDLKMEYVYDYMFHVLNEYAKLLRFKPVIPQGAVELCPDTMACEVQGTWRRMMVDSLVRSPAQSAPCILPPAFDPAALKANEERNANLTRQVEEWEVQYWADFDKIHSHSS